MNNIDIYDKEYKCSKCGDPVNYGKVADSKDNYITKDRKPNNKKYGKESNVLSAAVDAGSTTLHKCYADLVERDYRELTSTPEPKEAALKPGELNVKIDPKNKESLDEFEKVVNDAYLRLHQIATRFAPEGAITREIHISTMGLMHNYFSFLRR